MAKSLLARGLGKLKRKKERTQKAARQGQYKLYLDTLPVDPHVVVLEARNGKAIDGNIYYILQELLTDPAYRDLILYVVTEGAAARAGMERKIGRMMERVEARTRAEASGAPAGGDAAEAARSVADVARPSTEALRPAADRIRFVEIHSEDYYKVMASAGYIFNDASIPNFFIKKSGQIYCNVWHGTPLKTMGRRVSHEPHAVGNVQKNFIIADYLLYPSEYMMAHMIEDYMIAGLSQAQILLGGYPRNSVFFDAAGRQALREKLLGEKSMRIYAYMPTWRPAMMGENLQKVLQELETALLPGERMYVNVHPLAEESVDLTVFEKVLPFPDDLETYEFLNACDGLLTDYSSVFYDFAVTGRKIVLLTTDEKEYFATRGLYEPLDSLPFPKVQTPETALQALRAPKEYDDGPFLEKYCAYERPDAAIQLVQAVLGSTGAPTMERRSMPDNGLPNVLVWGGDLAEGPCTDQVMSYLRQLDPGQANYYLTFNRADLKERYSLLFDLPEGIRFIGRAGRLWLTPVQRDAQESYEKGKLSFDDYWKIVRPAFARERQRYYGEMRIDRILQIPPAQPIGPASTKEELEFSTYGGEEQ